MKVSESGLKEFYADVPEKNLIPAKEAEVIADSLVDADLIGIKSYGITKIKDYLNRLEKGIIEKETKMDIVLCRTE